jgi:hypothetical protein
MAFSYSIKKTINGINGKLLVGTYTNTASSTGGDITLPLITVYALNLQPLASSVSLNQPVVNEQMPIQGKFNVSVTVVTSANESGTFTAIGI